MTGPEYCNALDYQRFATACRLVMEADLVGLEDSPGLLETRLKAAAMLHELRDTLHARLEVEGDDDGE